MDQAPTNRELFALVQRWLAANYPNEIPDALVIRWRDKSRRPLQLPLPLNVGTAGGGEPVKQFEPNAFQIGILEALAGKALRVDALAAIVKDRGKLYREPGGIKELERHGLVKLDKRIGYFRPDAPPPEMMDEGE